MGCVGSVEEQTKARVGNARDFGEVFSDEAADAAAVVTGAHAFTSKVRLRISCSKLINKDLTSKSDPFAVLSECEVVQGTEQWRELGRTEVVGNCLDPQFVRDVIVIYNFEKRQKLRVTVYDADTPGDTPGLKLADQDFLGQADFILPDLLTKDVCVITLPLTSDSQGGSRRMASSTVTVGAEELADVRTQVHFTVSASSLRKKGPCFVVISQACEGGPEWKPVFKSEVTRGGWQNASTPDARWAPFQIPMLQLCNGDAERPLKLEVFYHVGSGAHEFLGEVETNMRMLQEAHAQPGPTTFALGGKRKGNWGYWQEGKGVLTVEQLQLEERPSFLQYIQGGTEIGFVVAIDFTASNGNPSDPQSLHYYSSSMRYDSYGARPNPYMEAIRGVGRVLECYDADKRFPAYGFGGRMGNAPVAHAFPLVPSVECLGIDGVLSAYRDALNAWSLSGPTLFAPVINQAAAQAARIPPGQGYLCLLILTDGCIMDMGPTKQAIINASRLPMCILIVGVGNADFGPMEELDSDDKKLSFGNQVAEHDIVQFVPFSQYSNDGVALAAACLAELPGQLLRHMRSRGILPSAARVPGPPPVASAPPMPSGVGIAVPSAPPMQAPRV